VYFLQVFIDTEDNWALQSFDMLLGKEGLFQVHGWSNAIDCDSTVEAEVLFDEESMFFILNGTRATLFLFCEDEKMDSFKIQVRHSDFVSALSS
jgi:hypothetical protein